MRKKSQMRFNRIVRYRGCQLPIRADLQQLQGFWACQTSRLGTLCLRQSLSSIIFPSISPSFSSFSQPLLNTTSTALYNYFLPSSPLFQPGLLPPTSPLCFIDHARRAMTSASTRRSFGGNPLQTQQSHSRSSSSTTSLIKTPSDTSAPSSPLVDMALRNGSAGTTNGISNDLERTQISATRKKRQQSSPLMPAFMVSAPGKVIVFGEHAVVHGKVHHTCLSCLSEHC